MQPLRRHLLGLGAALASARTVAIAAPTLARRLEFPRDAGAHTEAQTEWWYLTGWASAADADADAGGAVANTAAAVAEAVYGFQITFFRRRVDSTQGLRSRLAARQLLFAHAALTDLGGRRLWHDQRLARWSGEAPGQNPGDSATASTQDTGVLLGDWSLLREGADLRVRVQAEGFGMDLRLAATQPVLLQGQQGLSRKGPLPRHSSYYYSLPQLRASGHLTLQGRALALGRSSSAWLDHEWSDEILPAGAVGWDWLGINLFDGSALTAFRLRQPSGDALWDGGSFRAAPGTGAGLQVFNHGEVQFQALRSWRSPRSQASYPVEWRLRTPTDSYTVRALLDDQEQDSRRSTGAIYWEGLCELWDSHGRKVGRGYLEMTGYTDALKI